MRSIETIDGSKRTLALPAFVTFSYIGLGFVLLYAGLSSVVATGICDVLLVLVYLWCFRKYSLAFPVRSYSGLSSVACDVFLFSLLFFGIWLFGLIGGNWLFTTFGDTTYDVYQQSAASPGFVFVSIVLAPIAEECLFRGLWFLTVSSAWSDFAGLLLQAVLFSVLHGTMFHLLPGFLLGLFFGLVYYWTGRLWICVVLHVLYNVWVSTASSLSISSILCLPFVWIPCILGLLYICFIWFRVRQSELLEGGASDGTKET